MPSTGHGLDPILSLSLDMPKEAGAGRSRHMLFRHFNARKSKVHPRQISGKSRCYVAEISSLGVGESIDNGPRLAPTLDKAHG